MAQMYRASQDGIAFVEQIGRKLREVPPRYAQHVLGDIHSKNFPEAEQSRIWLRTFLIVHARFNGRDFDTAKPLKLGRDYRWTEPEIGHVAALAQWLIGLDAAANHRQTGVPTPAKQLTVNVADMIVREKIFG